MLTLFCDRPTKPDRYYVAEEEESMFVPPEVQETVAFIYCNYKGQKTPCGTVFFIAIRDGEERERGWTYAVTARHVLEGIRENAEDEKVIFRLNRRGGRAEFVDTNLADWKVHKKNPMLDVAVLSWTPPFADFGVRIIWSEMFATDFLIKTKGVGTGDEVFIAGLFHKRLGQGRNIPIVRIGNISAMPGEPIPTKVGQAKGAIRGYLIEARSISGLSGSPVFVNLGQIRNRGPQEFFTTETKPEFYLLGLVHGHWDEDVPKKKFPLTERLINTGVAIVVPMQEILEVLNQAELVRERKQQKEHAMKKNLPKQDASLLARAVVEAAIDEPLTKPRKGKRPARKAKRAAR